MKLVKAVCNWEMRAILSKICALKPRLMISLSIEGLVLKMYLLAWKCPCAQVKYLNTSQAYTMLKIRTRLSLHQQYIKDPAILKVIHANISSSNPPYYLDLILLPIKSSIPSNKARYSILRQMKAHIQKTYQRWTQRSSLKPLSTITLLPLVKQTVLLLTWLYLLWTLILTSNT